MGYRYLLPVRIRAKIRFEENFTVKDYTAKLIKTLLLSGNPQLKNVLSKAKNIPPKPIHLTPLFKNENGRKKAIYSCLIPKNKTARPPKIRDIKPVKIRSNVEYIFYIGTTLDLLDEVLTGLSHIGYVQFGKGLVWIGRLSYDIEYIDVEKEVEKLLCYFTETVVKGEGKIKIIFESPTLLKDPLALGRKKKKLLLPLPEAVFSVPYFMVMLSRGLYKTTFYLRSMRYIKSMFDLPYTVLKTVDLAWYVYDDRPLPALIGYVVYFIDYEMLNHVQVMMSMKYGLDFLELFAKAMVLAQVYGVGDGRAAGFGHVSITNR